jgi:hypothetical protein
LELWNKYSSDDAKIHPEQTKLLVADLKDYLAKHNLPGHCSADKGQHTLCNPDGELDFSDFRHILIESLHPPKETVRFLLEDLNRLTN